MRRLLLIRVPSVVLVLVGATCLTFSSVVVAATILGSAADETINGTPNDDYIDSAAGDDRVFADDGADEAHGSQDKDLVFGQHGFDDIFGGPNGDQKTVDGVLKGLDGGLGNNAISGGTGDDFIRDTDDDSEGDLEGDEDDDLIYAVDNTPDHLLGGGGDDTCRVDENKDDWHNCENVIKVP